nr:small multi-drug export protein [Lachnospiraceae bacterium]
PLPGTGAWTGSLIAALLGIKNRKAVPAIFLGLLMATVIICVIFYGILGQVW